MPLTAEPAVSVGPAAGSDGTGEAADRHVLVLGAAVAGAAFMVVAYLVSDVLRIDFFFDEMWRADFIRSADPVARMTTHDTPVPLGWVLFMKAAVLPLPGGPGTLRLVSIACSVAFAAVTFVTLARIGERAPLFGRSGRIPAVVAAGAVLAVVMSQGLGIHFGNFNNYPFEALWMAALVLASLELDDRRAWWLFLGLTATSPLFVIGPLLAVPALVLRALLWARDQGDDARRRLTELGLACGGMALSGLAMYLLLYRTVTSAGTVSGFWAGQSLEGGLGDLPDRLPMFWEQLGGDVLHPRVFSGDVRTVAGVLAIAAFALGLWEIGRRWPWYPATLLCGLVLTIPAGLLVGWPVTPVRVNLAFVVMIYTMTAYGLFRAVQVGVSRLAGSRTWPVALAALIVLAVLWPPQIARNTTVFARGLAEDLEPVANSPVDGNVVLSYHFMSHFYVHDTLLNTDRGDRQFVIEREERGDPYLYDQVDAITGRLDPGDVLWCVRPWALGPEVFARACQFDDPDLVEIHRSDGWQAEITGYRLQR